MTICSECKNNYNTYPVFLSGETESIAFEFSLRDIYYDDENNIGLCKSCRDKICSDEKQKKVIWALALGKTYVLEIKAKADNNEVQARKYAVAAKRIEKLMNKEIAVSIEIPNFEEEIKNHPKTEDCKDEECIFCGYRDCPHHEPLHYHHDGCPSCCFENEEKIK